MRKIYFGHEKLDVYRLSLKYVSIEYELSNKLKGHNRHVRDQLLHISQSISFNIAEGIGKTSEGDRHHFFEIARGSAFECAAIQDVLQNGNAKEIIKDHRGNSAWYMIKNLYPVIRGWANSAAPLVRNKIERIFHVNQLNHR